MPKFTEQDEVVASGLSYTGMLHKQQYCAMSARYFDGEYGTTSAQCTVLQCSVKIGAKPKQSTSIES